MLFNASVTDIGNVAPELFRFWVLQNIKATKDI